jgi:hypothetical protein
MSVYDVDGLVCRLLGASGISAKLYSRSKYKAD